MRHRPHGTAVRSGHSAHRPIGTDHQTLRPKSFESDVQVGRHIVRPAVVPIRLRDWADNLQKTLGNAATFRILSVQGCRILFLIGGLARLYRNASLKFILLQFKLQLGR